MPFDGSKVETVAAKMRALFGPNGEHWCRGLYAWDDQGHASAVCLIGAYAAVHAYNSDLLRVEAHFPWLKDVDYKTTAYRALAEACAKLGAAGRWGELTSTIFRNNDTAASFATIRDILDEMERLEIQEMVHAV